MKINYSIREAVHSDAPDFASSQILAWRAAYAGMLDASYLAGMDVERLALNWAAILRDTDQSVRRLAVTVEGAAVGWPDSGGRGMMWRRGPGNSMR